MWAMAHRLYALNVARPNVLWEEIRGCGAGSVNEKGGVVGLDLRPDNRSTGLQECRVIARSDGRGLWRDFERGRTRLEASPWDPVARCDPRPDRPGPPRLRADRPRHVRPRLARLR
jgi:hypothetical protein